MGNYGIRRVGLNLRGGHQKRVDLEICSIGEDIVTAAQLIAPVDVFQRCLEVLQRCGIAVFVELGFGEEIAVFVRLLADVLRIPLRIRVLPGGQKVKGAFGIGVVLFIAEPAEEARGALLFIFKDLLGVLLSVVQRSLLCSCLLYTSDAADDIALV